MTRLTAWLAKAANGLSISTPMQLSRAGVLSMNGRNLNYISRYNPRKLLPLVDDKLATKRMAEKAGIDAPKLIGVIEYPSDIRHLHTLLQPLEQFVIKPAKGSGGKGILVITDRDGDRFVKASGESLSFAAVSRDVSNILGGLYSLGGKADIAIIERLIIADPLFRHYSVEGVPDIRIIVFRGFPVMAMMRLATRASDGKANLHQGAIGVGLDIASGRTLQAVQHNRPVYCHPDTGYAFGELNMPHWQKILHLSANCYDITGLGFLGVDLVLDQQLGPQILELNARPGLAIQIANGQGIRPRLETIEALHHHDQPVAERVRFAQEQFITAP